MLIFWTLSLDKARAGENGIKNVVNTRKMFRSRMANDQTPILNAIKMTEPVLRYV